MDWKNEKLLRKVVSKHVSYAKVLRELKLVPAGGNYRVLKHYIKAYQIDTSHMTGQSWSAGLNKTSKITRETFLQDILVTNSRMGSSKVKQFLFKFEIKPSKCEKCGQGTTWKGKSLSLHLDHIDGDSTNNTLDNLAILCPNCHSQTETYCRRKNKRGQKKSKTSMSRKCKNCENPCSRYSKSGLCNVCSRIQSRRVNRPSKSVLITEVSKLGFSAVGRKYGVSDNAIRKWLK